VPKDAIATRDGKTVVFEVRDDKKVYELPITAGIENQDQVVIKQGLAGTETLVLHPSDKLKDGDAVKIKS
jgi:multidrug efflux pump subunit AcrA (membrane-fusion protein)